MRSRRKPEVTCATSSGRAQAAGSRERPISSKYPGLSRPSKKKALCSDPPTAASAASTWMERVLPSGRTTRS